MVQRVRQSEIREDQFWVRQVEPEQEPVYYEHEFRCFQSCDDSTVSLNSVKLVSPSTPAMTAPVPKPRTRYMFSKNSQNGSSESSNVVKHETQTDNKISEVNSAEVNGGLCVSPAGLPRLRETHDSSGADIVEKFLWPSSPPQSPVASDDEDSSECVKENFTSDSSTDEGLMTPLTPQSDTANNLHPPEECHNSTNTESAPQETNSQPKNAALCKPSALKKPKQTPIPKKPRAATIRVSRRKSSGAAKNITQAAESSYRESAVSRSSWLDVWKGRKHNVLWTTFDGQVMALWKKRTDKVSEYVFHVSSITNVHQQDRGHFLIYFRKKHFEFMAPTEDVRMGWITSLLASRGREAPAPPLHHGSLTMKEPRSKVYCSISGHNLWIYNSKEDFNLGLGMTFVYMNVASVKQTGRHSFSLITPYKTFNFSADSSRDLLTWLDLLNEVICSALSCSEVAQRLWSSPWNKVCADCGSPNPEWASINLLMVICEACAGVHRMMGANRSKVRSLKLDVKVWTEPLIQLFVLYGNKASNNVWGHNVPAVDQISPTAETQQRTAFINAKYYSGLYRKAHPLACSQKLLNQRLCEVVCGADVEETLALLCSGAKVLGGGGPSAITLAENAGQALQTELLRHNEFVETPDFKQQTRQKKEQTRLEELHGRLDDERFLFSQETQSAACDVLDLREVISVFNQSTGHTHEFEILTLTDSLTCTADTQDMLLNHMLHIIKVAMSNLVMEEELDGVMGVSQLSLREGSGLKHAEVWVMIRPGEIIIYPIHTHTPRTPITLNQHTCCNLCLLENTVEVIAAEKTVYLQFEREESCSKFYTLLSSAASSDRKSYRRSLYTLPAGVTGRVPSEVQRCISHITLYGLKVEGLYRCCGSVTKISELVEKLHKDPEVVLETNEIFVQEVAGVLKHFLRNSTQLIPSSERESWVSAAALTEVTSRLQEYRRLVKLLPPDNRALLSALFNHLNNVQLYSQVNKMTARNLAVVFVPTLFEDLAMNQSIVHLMRELIIHHTLIFLGKDETPVEEEMITAL